MTGCESGFGFLLAKKLDALGINVFAGCLTIEGQKDLRKQTSGHVTILSLDVTKETSIRDAYEEVVSRIPADQGRGFSTNRSKKYLKFKQESWRLKHKLSFHR